MFFAKSLVALLAAGSSALGTPDIQLIFLLRRLIVAHDSYYHNLPLPVRLLVRDFPPISSLLSYNGGHAGFRTPPMSSLGPSTAVIPTQLSECPRVGRLCMANILEQHHCHELEQFLPQRHLLCA